MADGNLTCGWASNSPGKCSQWKQLINILILESLLVAGRRLTVALFDYSVEG